MPTLHRTVVDYANFDHAASTPALESVKAAVDVALRTYSSVHRGNGYASRVTSGWYEEARAEVGAVRRRPRGGPGRLHPQHHRLAQPARPQPPARHHHVRLRVRAPRRAAALEPAPHGAPARPRQRRRRAGAAARRARGRPPPARGWSSSPAPRTSPASCGRSSEVVAIARTYGARVALDAAQLAPHGAVDIDALGVDFVAFSGHKLYAPFGAGVLAGRADWLDARVAVPAGGGATAQVTPTRPSVGAGAARHEAGSPNVHRRHRPRGGLRDHRAAPRRRRGPRGRAGHPPAPRAGAASTASRTYSMFGRGPPARRRRHVHHRGPGQLAGGGGPVRRARHRCARRQVLRALLVDALLDDESTGTAVRASVGLANTVEHVDRLLHAVAALAAGGPAFDYERTPRDGSRPRTPATCRCRAPGELAGRTLAGMTRASISRHGCGTLTVC